MMRESSLEGKTFTCKLSNTKRLSQTSFRRNVRGGKQNDRIKKECFKK